MTCKTNCTSCGCVNIAAKAEQLRAVIAGAVSLHQGGPELEGLYGGGPGLRRVLEEQLLKAEALAGELARDTAAAAGTCIGPVVNDSDSTRRP